MQVMDKVLEGNKRRMLLVMATGTGKTDTIALYLKRLFESGMVNRVLFLVDRIQLGIQTKEVFDEILSDYPSTLLYGGKQKDESSIVISTLQTLYSQLPEFTSGYFDVVISDEAHRAIFGIYNAVLSHFDAIRIGLTATPSGYVDRNTYKTVNYEILFSDISPRAKIRRSDLRSSISDTSSSDPNQGNYFTITNEQTAFR